MRRWGLGRSMRCVPPHFLFKIASLNEILDTLPLPRAYPRRRRILCAAATGAAHAGGEHYRQEPCVCPGLVILSCPSFLLAPRVRDACLFVDFTSRLISSHLYFHSPRSHCDLDKFKFKPKPIPPYTSALTRVPPPPAPAKQYAKK